MANRKPLVLINGIWQEIPATDTLLPANIGTGTRDGTKFLRDDGTWQTVTGGATTSTPYQEQLTGTVNGSNTAFTLPHTPGDGNEVKIFIDGVYQYPTTDYTISGTSVTFVTAPASGSTVYAAYNSSPTGAQPLNTDLTAIAALTPTNDDIIQRKAGAWTNRSMSQLKTDLALAKADVGLSNVDNTSDATKNSSVATLTNKTIDLASNTLSTTKAQLNSAISDADVATLAGSETLTNKTLDAPVFAAGSATAASKPKLSSGTVLTTPEAGALEYDGANMFITNETTAGRGLNLVEQKFRLTAAGSNISTIGNFFGTNSNIPLVANAEYEIEIEAWFTKNTAGTVTWTFTNSAAPTSMTLEYQLSAAGGIVGTAAATTLFGAQYNLNTTAPTIVTASLTNSTVHFHRIRIRLINGTGTSLKLQMTAGAGTVTPGINSNWKCRRVPAANVGTFAA
jgi:hypothetical protein